MPFFDEVLGERAGEAEDRPLGRAVVEQLRRALVGRHRCAVDDRGALLEVRPRSLRHEEHAEDVGLERPPQLVLVDVGDVLVGMLLAGIVDEDVEPAELLDRLPDGPFAELLVADVAGDRDRSAAFLLDDLLRLLRIVMLAQIKDCDVGAFAREQRGDGAADSAVGAGDQRDLALEPIRARDSAAPSPAWARAGFRDRVADPRGPSAP